MGTSGEAKGWQGRASDPLVYRNLKKSPLIIFEKNSLFGEMLPPLVNISFYVTEGTLTFFSSFDRVPLVPFWLRP
jgi:hypothetical protein